MLRKILSPVLYQYLEPGKFLFEHVRLSCREVESKSMLLWPAAMRVMVGRFEWLEENTRWRGCGEVLIRGPGGITRCTTSNS